MLPISYFEEGLLISIISFKSAGRSGHLPIQPKLQRPHSCLSSRKISCDIWGVVWDLPAVTVGQGPAVDDTTTCESLCSHMYNREERRGG